MAPSNGQFNRSKPTQGKADFRSARRKTTGEKEFRVASATRFLSAPGYPSSESGQRARDIRISGSFAVEGVLRDLHA